jgi:hypothetical protein
MPTLAIVFLLLTVPASAQQRPLLTEDPDPVGEGKMLIEAGIEHTRAQRYTVSGLEGNLLRGPLLGISTGVGSSAELQLDGLSWSRLAIRERFNAPLSSMLTSRGESTSSVEDLVLGTKVRLLRETNSRPSLGLRFATKLPNAGNEKGLGLDTMDFFQSLLVAKSVSATRLVGNVGMAILSDPTRGDRQNDVLTYGFSVVQSFTSFAVAGDINGWVSTRAGVPPPGTETRGTATIGVRYPVGAVRLDGGVFTALTSDDDRKGVKGGLTWTFDSFLGDKRSLCSALAEIFCKARLKPRTTTSVQATSRSAGSPSGTFPRCGCRC